MSAGTDPLIEDYRRRRLGYLRVLAVRIEQTPPELGEPCQTVQIELLRHDLGGKAVLAFTGVQELRIGSIQPGILCGLQIESVKDDLPFYDGGDSVLIFR